MVTAGVAEEEEAAREEVCLPSQTLAERSWKVIIKKSAEDGGRKGAEGPLGSSRVATPPPGSERTMSHRSGASRLSGPGPPAAGEPPRCAHSRGAGRETESSLALCLQPAAKADALLGPRTGLEGEEIKK